MNFQSFFSYLCLSVFICGSFFFRDAHADVVLYTSVDQQVAEPIIKDFEKQSGIKVRLVTDTEATKSVGLAERLRAEKDNPQADVWWGNEPFNTINLAHEGVLEKYSSKAVHDAEDEMPTFYRHADQGWLCNGLRARTLVTADSHLSLSKIEDLADPSLKGKIAMARPTAGTTGGHVAALFVKWGDERAIKFFQHLHDNNVKLVGGNSVVADLVSKGTMLAGLTDNDDAAASAAEGGKMTANLPDQDSFGTLAIPTTIGLVKGSAKKDDAGKLIDYLVSVQVEKKMLDAKFVGWSIRSDPEGFKAMDVDYDAVAKAMPAAIRKATAILEGRE